LNPYELMLIFDPNLGEEKIGQIIAKIEDKIKGFEASDVKTEKWGIKGLAVTFQKIKKLKQAYYVIIRFKAAPSVPAQIQGYLKVTENIIRYSVYRTKEEKKEAPSEKIQGTPLVEEKKEAKIG